MFDISSEEINQLNDIDLRELVGRLCEAELESRGLSSSGVTWGGNQTASDGGLDVRVELPAGVFIEGFIPRGCSGFQVKKPAMPKAKIILEMCPKGEIRPSIQELADEAGAYIIISSTGSTADSALRNRRAALREALKGVANADRLYTDFYDRNRLATWVRCYPSLIALVKERIGRSFSGWRPYAQWSGAVAGGSSDYLLDDKLRLYFGRRDGLSEQSMEQAIERLRDELIQPRKIIRLVGLSGVGKTRLAEVLFDSHVGERALPKSLAVYTNLSDTPSPQPTGMASDLIASRKNVVLIVDNCPPDLHHRLSEVCRDPNSTISVLTIEYDIRNDQPEGTQVVTLEASSNNLIYKLLQRRYVHLSQVDARTIAEASGGNARIAIALAETVDRTETIAGLTNDQLFGRLFQQRQAPNDGLFLAAQACSLVYSFCGETQGETNVEYSVLAVLAGQVSTEMYRHMGELVRRDLMQQRGVWRAVLPHAIANRLAARALEDIPLDLINQQLVNGGNDRLTRSFSRRLSFLHDQPKAVAIVKEWLLPDGLLGNIGELSEVKHDMFENISSVLPESALAALERVAQNRAEVAVEIWLRHQSLLRSLAYDSGMFGRSASLLVVAATQSTNDEEARAVSEVFVSLFTIKLSGTHASIEQRLSAIESLLRSGNDRKITLGIAALGKILETVDFTSSYQFEFGARSRNYGYFPQSEDDVTSWFLLALLFVERIARVDIVLKLKLGGLLARRFRCLWIIDSVHVELGRIFRYFAAGEFWLEGWVACKETTYFDKEHMTPGAALILAALQKDLDPSDLRAKVKAVVLGSQYGEFDLDELDEPTDIIKAVQRLEISAGELGEVVANDRLALAEILPDLLCGGKRVFSFGRGLARSSLDCQSIWGRLVHGLEAIAPESRDAQVLSGFLVGIHEQNRDLARSLLTTAFDYPWLKKFLPMLNVSLGLDAKGVAQLKRLLVEGDVPVCNYLVLAYGGATSTLEGGAFKDLVKLISEQSDGFDVALEIIAMRLFSDRNAKLEHKSELKESCRALLERIEFRKTKSQTRDRYLSDIMKFSLGAPDAYSIAESIAARLVMAVTKNETYAFDQERFLVALFVCQPIAALECFFSDGNFESLVIRHFFLRFGRYRKNPTEVISCDAIVSWCEKDSERRYPFMASIITFSCHSDTNSVLDWSLQAKLILNRAPDTRRVLEVFIKQFRPMSWSVSRASIFESYIQLLDKLDMNVTNGFMLFVAEEKTKLMQELLRERLRETEMYSASDESFE